MCMAVVCMCMAVVCMCVTVVFMYVAMVCMHMYVYVCGVFVCGCGVMYICDCVYVCGCGVYTHIFVWLWYVCDVHRIHVQCTSYTVRVYKCTCVYASVYYDSYSADNTHIYICI